MIRILVLIMNPPFPLRSCTLHILDQSSQNTTIGIRRRFDIIHTYRVPRYIQSKIRIRAVAAVVQSAVLSAK